MNKYIRGIALGVLSLSVCVSVVSAGETPKGYGGKPEKEETHGGGGGGGTGGGAGYFEHHEESHGSPMQTPPRGEDGGKKGGDNDGKKGGDNNGRKGRVLGASATNFTRNLKSGHKGDDVKALQEFLQTNGHMNASSTGYFGPMTREALKKWQKANSLPSTGFFGPLSRDIINKSNS